MGGFNDKGHPETYKRDNDKAGKIYGIHIIIHMVNFTFK